MSGEQEELAGADLESAREYVFAYAVDVKRLDKEIAEGRSQVETWKGRAALAQSKGMADLAQAAEARRAEEEGKLSPLEAERAGLAAKLSRLREQLPMIRARERSVDPDRLLAELQLMTGELLGDAAAATDKAFAELEAGAAVDSALADLKKRADGNSGSPGGAGDGGAGDGGAGAE
jgi:phage shock protein A